MSILNSASNRTVYRGYDYYKEGNMQTYGSFIFRSFSGRFKRL